MDHRPWTLEVLKHRLDTCVLRQGSPPVLGPGELRVQIERLALSANTMTYATLGDALGYWSLFPASAPGWGQIPAWGHGRVVESAVEGLVEGVRLFGLWPMSDQAVLCGRRSRLGLRETSPHRIALNPVYNQYAVVPCLEPAALDVQALLRPLLITSLVLAEHLVEQDGFGATTIVVISASSKVALGLARQLAGRWPLVGLTSSGNQAWVERTGLYARVLGYDTLAELGPVGPSLVLDFAGDVALTDRLCELPGFVLRRLIRIGATHSAAPNATRADGADAMFWSPAHIEQRVASWGPAAFEQRLDQAIDAFIATAGACFERQYADGPQSLCEAYRQLQRGAVAPQTWLVARPALCASSPA